MTASDLAREMGRRFRAGDFDGAFALLHPEFRILQPGSLPHGGWHHGSAGMAEMGARFAEHWTRTIGEAHLFGDGDFAAQTTAQTWTSLATGRSATVEVVELFTADGDLIREIRVFQQDTHALLATLDRPAEGKEHK
ncbi:nuclear transport factor 2 family protein [Actinocorallia longicatena]|uniref:SnoaL-like domain-containing protein n=1 Tax=Actinocorallia longicatena TaxID=111803 RepID=A0ABP6Q5G2_9ACTN